MNEPKWKIDLADHGFTEDDFPLRSPESVSASFTVTNTPAMLDALIDAGMVERLTSINPDGTVKEEILCIDEDWPNIIE